MLTDAALVAELARLFAGGLTFDEYVATVPCHSALWSTRRQALASMDLQSHLVHMPLATGPVSALVLTEPWCVDAVMNVTLLHQAAELEPRLGVRLVPFSEHAVACRFPGRGGRPRVPTIVFFDRLSARVEYWSERSRPAHDWFEIFTRERPMPPLAIVEDRPATPELDAWMRARFECESAACGGQLWVAAVAEWRDRIARLHAPPLRDLPRGC